MIVNSQLPGQFSLGATGKRTCKECAESCELEVSIQQSVCRTVSITQTFPAVLAEASIQQDVLQTVSDKAVTVAAIPWLYDVVRDQLTACSLRWRTPAGFHTQWFWVSGMSLEKMKPNEIFDFCSYLPMLRLFKTFSRQPPALYSFQTHEWHMAGD